MKILFLLCLIPLIGCESKASKEAKRQTNLAASLIATIQQETGVSYEFVRLGNVNGYAVLRNSATQELVAMEVTAWDPLTMTTLDQFTGNVVSNLQAKQEWVVSGYNEDIYDWRYVYRDEYNTTCSCYQSVSSYEYVRVGYRWVDTSHYETFYHGGGFRFDNAQNGGKDLETLAALKEAEAKGILQANLKSQYALSSNRAAELADVSYKFLRLENRRELTTAEKDQFAKKALGVSLSDIESALLQKAVGSEAAYEALLKEAAAVNRTSPEMIGKFFDEMIEL